MLEHDYQKYSYCSPIHSYFISLFFVLLKAKQNLSKWLLQICAFCYEIVYGSIADMSESMRKREGEKEELEGYCCVLYMISRTKHKKKTLNKNIRFNHRLYLFNFMHDFHVRFCWMRRAVVYVFLSERRYHSMITISHSFAVWELLVLNEKETII